MSASIAGSGSPNRSLAVGTTSGTDWVAGAWTVGRGLYAGGHTNRAYGLNYEREGSTGNNRRHVLMVTAFRRDMGIQ